MIVKYEFLHCDRCGGDEFDAFAPYAADVREVASLRGWRIGRKDHCPICVAQMEGRDG